MAAFKDLPNELLDLIADNLPTGALCALSLTSRKFCAISVPYLYKTVRIPTPFEQAKDWENRVVFLTRTLTGRPDLAARITALDASIYHLNGTYDLRRFAPQSLTAVYGILNSTRVAPKHGYEMALRVYGGCNEPCFGVLMYILPNLESLFARFFTDISLSPANPEDLVDVFFNPDHGVGSAPSLSKVKKLDLQCTRVHMNPGIFPKHAPCWIDGSHTVMSINPNSNSSLRSPEITEIYSRESTNQLLTHNLWSRFSSRTFPALRRLDVDLDNIWRNMYTHEPVEVLCPGTTGWSHYLVSRLRDIKDTLEELRLTVRHGADTRFLEYIEPFTDPFTDPPIRLHNLKIFWLPQELLLPRDIEDRDFRDIDHQLLPAGLQSLRLLYPTMKTHSWLKGYLPNRVNLPSLQSIETMVTSKQGSVFLTHRQTDFKTWTTTTTRGTSDRVAEASAIPLGESETQSTKEAELLFEVALRDKHIEELEKLVAETAIYV
ncbi:hypothetical protein P171DRAFT_133637 [Karstenula rhodostoma CBS 690.94]|uniref:F-box domain-containing protein n=1 Tax=Karstenula rhodostoma CBS 690.94 TaxID=1392251 RepID=A0A9P4P6D9_9PLEO|nr:hypothetical protein P171DRAFT_133637 [Karstenula rhodostoma CBS 690.94]